MENKDNFKCISILLWFVNTFFFIFITYYLLDYYELVDANENYNNQFNNTHIQKVIILQNIVIHILKKKRIIRYILIFIL